MCAFGKTLFSASLALSPVAAIAIDEYRLDDGIKELGIGVQSPNTNSFAWLNRFVVQPNHETITAVRLAFGGGPAQTNIANGQPVTVYLWDDVNQDGDPSDAWVLASATGVVQGSGTNAYTTIAFSPPVTLTLGRIFFAGAIINYNGQVLVGSLDVDGTDDVQPWPAAFHSFVASSDNGTPVNPNGLALAQGPVASVSSAIFGGSDDATWMIRLNAPPPNTAQLDIDPNPLDFGMVSVGTVFGPVLVKLENIGTANLDIAAITGIPLPFFSPPPAGPMCPSPPFSLLPHEFCTLHYSFGPTATGLHAANVGITSNAPTSPDLLQLMGFGVVGPAPGPLLTPPALDMGQVDVDASSALHTITFTNTGTLDWIVTDVQVTDPSLPPSPFTFTFANCSPPPIVLAPGMSCDLNLVFSPYDHGVFARSYEFVGNTPPGSVVMTLKGKGMLFGDGFEVP